MAQEASRRLEAGPRILIVDDDERLTALVREYLSGFGFVVQTAAHPRDGLKAIKASPPDLVVLDVMLPETDGLSLCRTIRSISRTPIIMLTARGDTADRIVGLELGADDYMSKPFEPRELVARIQAVLRRGSHAPAEVVRGGPVELNWSTRTATLDGRPIQLTAAEFELLGLFLRNRDRVLTRDQIMESVSGMDSESYDRSVDVLVSRLRQKLSDDARRASLIRTVRGIGYSFGSTSD